jgi:hypothetical protein
MEQYTPCYSKLGRTASDGVVVCIIVHCSKKDNNCVPFYERQRLDESIPSEARNTFRFKAVKAAASGTLRITVGGGMPKVIDIWRAIPSDTVITAEQCLARSFSIQTPMR